MGWALERVAHLNGVKEAVRSWGGGVHVEANFAGASLIALLANQCRSEAWQGVFIQKDGGDWACETRINPRTTVSQPRG